MDFVDGDIILNLTKAYFDTSWNVRVPGNFPVLGSCPSQPRRRHYGAKGWTGSPRDHRCDTLGICIVYSRISIVSFPRVPWESRRVWVYCNQLSSSGHQRDMIRDIEVCEFGKSQRHCFTVIIHYSSSSL